MSTLTLRTATSSAEIDTNGAYLTVLKAGVKNVLFPAQYIGEKLRGGIPVCAPVFGPGDAVGLKQHGFARDTEWKVLRQSDTETLYSVAEKLNFKKETALHGSVEIMHLQEYDVTEKEVDEWPEITFSSVPDWLAAKRKN